MVVCFFLLHDKSLALRAELHLSFDLPRDKCARCGQQDCSNCGNGRRQCRGSGGMQFLSDLKKAAKGERQEEAL